MFGKRGEKKDDKKKKKQKEEEKASSAIRGQSRAPAAQEEHADEAQRKEEEERKRKEREEKRKEKEKRRDEDKKTREKEKEEADKRRKDELSKKETEARRVGEDVSVELAALEAAKGLSSESPTAHSDAYNLFSDEVFATFSEIVQFSRDLNERINTQEIVLIGPRSHGKSSLLECLLGQPMNTIGYDGASFRPLYINMVNNLECATPRVTIKRDTSVKDCETDMVVPLEELAAQIKKRNSTSPLSDEGIYVQWESKSTWNITFIDAPGIIFENGTATQQSSDISVKLASPLHRTILAVEEASAWELAKMRSFIKSKLDPELSRTTFVYSKMQTHLQSFTSSREVNRYLCGAQPDLKTFWVTVPSSGVREKNLDPDAFKKKTWQAISRDFGTLEQLQYDKSFEGSIGVHALNKYLANMTWKSYQAWAPKVLKKLRSKKAQCAADLVKVKAQLAALDTSKLRSIASNYTVNFLHIIERLIAGTSEGNPAVNGQTLRDEKVAHGDGDWVDANNKVIKVDPEEWGIPYWESKLYGGQQFERLLSEFKAVGKNTGMGEIAMDEVATSAGLNKLNNIPNYAWAASDLAQQKSHDAFVPLIEQTTSRAIYIMVRLSEIVDSILSQRKKANAHMKSMYGAPNVEDIDQYPYFTHHVKSLFCSFVEKTAAEVKEKSLDEFYSTRTIYWHLTEQGDHSLPMDHSQPEETRVAVAKLSGELFGQIKNRIIKNVLLKFYNFFLVPMQTELWNNIQGQINCLTDPELEQHFEVAATKEKLKEEQANLESIIAKCGEQEGEFLKASTHFSHPTLGKSDD